MRSHTFLRAGLVAITLALCVIFTSAVPVPSTSLSCSLHPKECLISKRDLTLTERSDIEFDIDSRYFTAHSEDLVLRDDVDHMVTLVRRKSIFTKMKEGFKKLGKGIKNVAKKIGTGIKKVAKKIGTGIKTAAKKVGAGMKTAAKKVGHFVKTTGAKIAKFGLKIVSTAGSVLSKVAKFIPVIGKPLSGALKAGGMAANAASNAIHAKLPKKLEKGMKIMNKIQNPVSGAAGAVLDALKREVGETDTEILSR